VDDKSEPCQRFFREGLTMSFTKVMLDDAVINWKEEIQVTIISRKCIAQLQLISGINLQFSVNVKLE